MYVTCLNLCTIGFYILPQRSENQSSRTTAMAAKDRRTKTDKTSKSMLKDQTANQSIVTNVKKPLHTSTPAEVFHHAENSKSNTAQKTDR
jgi:hypothetical protein